MRATVVSLTLYYVDRPSKNSSSNQYPKDGYKNRRFANRGNNRSNRTQSHGKQSGKDNLDKWGRKTNPLDKFGKSHITTFVIQYITGRIHA